MKPFLSAGLLLSGVLLAGCAAGDHRDDRYAAVGEREEWNRLHADPVCGHTVNPKSARYKEPHNGRWYYFENEECWRRFHDNPQAYVTDADDRPSNGDHRRGDVR